MLPVPNEPASPPTSVRWRVDRRFTAFTFTGALVFALAAWGFSADRLGMALMAVAALVCLGYGVRDLVAPVRLAADAGGVTVVRGYARREHLDWSQVERVVLDRRRRLGLRSELLEIDAGQRR